MNALFPPPSVARAFGHTEAQRRDRARALALAIVTAGSRETAARLVDLRRRNHDAGVALMLRQRHRITTALYPDRCPALWPIMGTPATECLSDCARMIKATEAQRDAGRWTYTVDPSRLDRLREAEDALLAIITGDDAPEAPEAS